jgi:type IV pilus assembly protein PilW
MVELMVGLLLGMLTMLVISQVLIQSENRKRTIAMGSDAQVNGALALYTLQREIQMAGYGASSPAALGCTVRAQYGAIGTPYAFSLAPVMIASGLGETPDTITVLQAKTASVSVPMKISEDHPQSAAYFMVDGALGVSQGDMVIAVPAIRSNETVDARVTTEAERIAQANAAGNNWCTLFQVTNDTASAVTTLSTTRIPQSTESNWNHSTIVPAVGYPSNSQLINMGAMTQRTYAINASQNLSSTDRVISTGAVTTQELFPQILTMKALYGKDTDNNGVVDRYDNQTPTTAAGWQQVLNIRIALVTRSGQYEKDVVTTDQPQWDVGSATTIVGPTTAVCHSSSTCITLTIPGSSTDTVTWKHYRYKVYDTLVPLRNVLWNS